MSQPSTSPRLAPGQRRTVTVTALGQSDGAIAVVPNDRRELRIPGAVPGDTVQVQVGHVGTHAAWASLVQVEIPSEDRVVVPCLVQQACGGCPWMPARLDLQRTTRWAAIEAALAPALAGQLARGEPPHLQLWPGQALTTGYRTRALVMLADTPAGLRWGLYAAGTERLVPTERCEAHHPGIDQILASVLKIMKFHGLCAWERRRSARFSGQEPGEVAAIQVRVDPHTEAVTLLLAVRDLARVEPLAAELLALPNVVTVAANIAQLQETSALGPETVLLAGVPLPLLRWLGPDGVLELPVAPGAFVQTRHDMAETLLAEVAASLPNEVEHLLDLYAGIGLMGLALAKRCSRLTLAERDPAAVSAARAQVERSEALGQLLIPTTVLCTDALATLGQLQGQGVTAALLDPPRAGCGEAVLQALDALDELRNLVLISCGLPGLARDALALTQRGWQVTRVAALDMFPHGPNAEVVLSLSRPRRDATGLHALGRDAAALDAPGRVAEAATGLGFSA